MSDLAARKAALRRVMLDRRAALARPAAAEAAASLSGHVQRGCPLPRGAIVSAYWPVGDELDPRPLLAALHARGHALALPVTPSRGHPLNFRRWQPGDPLVAARFGLSEPGPDAATVRPDVLLVPLLAFDRRGYRLGYGAGYYDRTLAALPDALAIGLGYAAQEVSEVPAGPHDAALRHVATERGVIACGAGA